MFTSWQHAAIAVIIAFSSTLAAPTPARAEPAPDGAEATPAETEPTPTPTRVEPPQPPVPTRARPEAVSLAIESSGRFSPDYRLQVRNATGKPVDVTVRQELPRGTRVTTMSAGGKREEAELVWRLRVPARNTAALASSLTHSGAVAPLFSPACAYERDGNRAYDCSAASWTPPAQIVPRRSVPWWQQPRNLTIAGLAVLLGVLLLWAVTRFVRRRRRRAAARPMIGPTPRDPMQTMAPPPSPRRRRKPPAFLVLGFGIVLLGAGAASGTGATLFGAKALGIGKPRTGGWVGKPAAGPVGTELREAAFEFTVYRIGCAEPRRGARRCIATVGVHNATNKDQLWYGPLQRAYLPTGSWVGTDEAATRQMNGGRDVFAEPVAAGQRLLLPLAFTVPSEQLLPSRIELRSGVFNAGVAVTPV